MRSPDIYDGLASFSDVKDMLDKVATHEELCALVNAVDERFLRDQQQLTIDDSDWEKWTLLVADKAAMF